MRPINFDNHIHLADNRGVVRFREETGGKIKELKSISFCFAYFPVENENQYFLVRNRDKTVIRP